MNYIKFMKKNIVFNLAVISLILFVLIFLWINFLFKNNYIKGNFEHFTNNTNMTQVNIPLTASYSCANFCGMGRCAVTGQQCIADIDCPGCTPNMSAQQKKSITRDVPGNNEAGKLTLGVTPQYSTLTSDIGTQAFYFKDKIGKKPSYANFGINTWSSSFNDTNNLFRTRYTPTDLQYTPEYTTHDTTTGLFTNVGPYPSNAFL